MNEFEQYDPSQWLDYGMSRHLADRSSSAAASLKRSERSQLARLAFSVAAAASFFVFQNIAEPSNVGSSVPITASHLSTVGENPVLWLEASGGSLQLGPDQSDFASRSAEVVRQLRAGNLKNVPDDTLNLARAALERTHSNPTAEWIPRLAGEVAKLID